MASTEHYEQDFTPPPLPTVIVDVLNSANLCYLATSEDNIPHLSLMNFSVVDEQDIGCAIVLSTRRDTKKFAAIISNPRVAVLVHDFVGDHGTASVTINGTMHVTEGEQEERCRAAHLAKNAKMAQFIVGEQVAILVVTPQSARICNIQDKVTYWAPRSLPVEP